MIKTPKNEEHAGAAEGLSSPTKKKRPSMRGKRPVIRGKLDDLAEVSEDDDSDGSDGEEKKSEE